MRVDPYTEEILDDGLDSSPEPMRAWTPKERRRLLQPSNPKGQATELLQGDAPATTDQS